MRQIPCLIQFLLVAFFYFAVFTSLVNAQVKGIRPTSQGKAALLKTFFETAADRGLFQGAAIVVDSREVIFEFANGDARWQAVF